MIALELVWNVMILSGFDQEAEGIDTALEASHASSGRQVGDSDAVEAAFQSEQRRLTPLAPASSPTPAAEYVMDGMISGLPRSELAVNQQTQAAHMAWLKKSIPASVAHAGRGERYAVHDIVKKAQQSIHATPESLRYALLRDREAFRGRAYGDDGYSRWYPTDHAVEKAVKNTKGTTNAAAMADVIRSEPKVRKNYTELGAGQLTREMSELAASDPGPRILQSLQMTAAMANMRPEGARVGTYVVPEYREYEGAIRVEDPELELERQGGARTPPPDFDPPRYEQ